MPDVEDVVFLQPGPVKIHPRVQRVLGMPTLHHRTPEFTAELNELTAGLQAIFQTRHDVTVLSGSGTAAMEAAIGSLAGKGERVVSLDNGKFGERLGEIAALHAESVVVRSDWGKAVDLDRVAAAIEEAPTKVFAFTLNETSTGAINDGAALAKLARKHDAFVVCDAITALGNVPVPVDEWGVDVCITGSQKCIAGPPGLAMLSVSPRAYDAARRFSYYLDLKRHVNKTREGSTPFTPAVPLYRAMNEAVKIALEEGLEARFARTRRLAEATRAGIDAMGLPFFCEPEVQSDTITAVRYPDSIEDAETKVRGRMKKDFGVLVAGGQAPYKGQIFRIGHMGNANASEIVACFHAIEACFAAAGWDFERGAGMAAASERLAA